MPRSDYVHGKWFRRVEFIVFPNLESVLDTYATNFKKVNAEIEAYMRAHPVVSSELVRTEVLTHEERTPRAQAQALDKEVRALVAELAESEPKLYNAQPPWSMTDVPARSIAEAKEILQEFFQFAECASDVFSWSFSLEEKKWMRHGWKHITLRNLERIADRVKLGKHPLHDFGPQFDLILDPSTDVHELFLNAAQRVPEAVARLDFLLPSEHDKLEVADLFLGLPRDQIQQLVSQIPSPGELAAECAEVAVRNPDSEEAAQARRTITALIAKSSAKGSRVGRPKIPFSGEAVATVYRMSYALYKQLKEVDRFLKKLVPGNEQRSQSLAGFYPWLARQLRPERITDFATSQPTQGACEIAAKVLGLSVSKISKAVVHA